MLFVIAGLLISVISIAVIEKLPAFGWFRIAGTVVHAIGSALATNGVVNIATMAMIIGGSICVAIFLVLAVVMFVREKIRAAS